ncbi:MAG: hypothetical protein ABSH20_02700 [Tepidisphaeraceae bacterium]|jgi:hypothetical protein
MSFKTRRVWKVLVAAWIVLQFLCIRATLISGERTFGVVVGAGGIAAESRKEFGTSSVTSPFSVQAWLSLPSFLWFTCSPIIEEQPMFTRSNSRHVDNWEGGIPGFIVGTTSQVDARTGADFKKDSFIYMALWWPLVGVVTVWFARKVWWRFRSRWLAHSFAKPTPTQKAITLDYAAPNENSETKR